MKGNGVGFSGSYEAGDVLFLLKPVQLETLGVAEKEREIQSGRRHYSEMISYEAPPAPDYMAVFRAGFARNRGRVGRDVAALATRLARRPGKEVVLVSFARAGTPVGVLLRRALVFLGRVVHHYSVSIIRDRGLDPMAMAFILDRHPVEVLVFVDGWTGKGSIRGTLDESVKARLPVFSTVPFCVLSDLAGVADLAAGYDDYLIPSALLNGIISGLVSRSILNREIQDQKGFHGCLWLDHLQRWDLSQWYVDAQEKDVRRALRAGCGEPSGGEDKQTDAARQSRIFLREMMCHNGITDVNRVKPGIGEATRTLLRRVPERLFVRDLEGGDVAHLLTLARDKGVAVVVDPKLPYQACAIIRSLGKTESIEPSGCRKTAIPIGWT